MHQHVAEAREEALGPGDAQVVDVLAGVGFAALLHDQIPEHVVGDVICLCHLIKHGRHFFW